MGGRTTAARDRTLKEARVAALCQHLRSAVDLLEQIGHELIEMDCNGPRGKAREPMPPPVPKPDVIAPVQAVKLAYTVKEAVAALGVSRSKLYILMGSGELPSVQIGKRRLIPAVALQKLIVT